MTDSEKKLNKLVKFCKKHNLTEIELDGIKLKFGSATLPGERLTAQSLTELPPANPEAGMPSDSDLMFWHVERPDLDEEETK